MSGSDDPVGRRHIRAATDCRLDWAGTGRVGKRQRPAGSGGASSVKNPQPLPEGSDTFTCGCTWKLVLYIFCLRAEGRPTAEQLGFRVLVEEHLDRQKRGKASSCSCGAKIDLVKRYIEEYMAEILPPTSRVSSLRPPSLLRTDFDLIAQQVDAWYKAG